jgi:hypothetical protein
MHLWPLTRLQMQLEMQIQTARTTKATKYTKGLLLGASGGHSRNPEKAPLICGNLRNLRKAFGFRLSPFASLHCSPLRGRHNIAPGEAKRNPGVAEADDSLFFALVFLCFLGGWAGTGPPVRIPLLFGATPHG